MGSVRLAVTDADMASARALSMEWLDWHWRTYPDIWPEGEDHPMEPRRYEAIVEDLPSIHARPLGGILIGSVEGRDCGCVMYNREEEGVAVFNRMFVGEDGRGHGLGRKMLEHMFTQMRADGYHKVIFSSATFLTHARAMYESAGFTPMAHPEGFPEAWRELVYFMERPLA